MCRRASGSDVNVSVDTMMSTVQCKLEVALLVVNHIEVRYQVEEHRGRLFKPPRQDDCEETLHKETHYRAGCQDTRARRKRGCPRVSER